MKLSQNFTLSELIKSETALRHGLDNTPDQQAIRNLSRVCLNILEPVRKHYARPIRPNSGYRSPAVNEKAGGSETSQHMKGEAVDFEIAGVDNYELACWLRDNLVYDQIILEYYVPGEPSSGWVHASFADNNRGNCLTYRKQGKKTVKLPGIVA